MTSEPTATVVVVCRDRWSLASETVHTLVARTDPRHRIVVVDARAPRAVGAAFDRLAAVDRVRVVRRPRVLAGNEARNAGADGATCLVNPPSTTVIPQGADLLVVRERPLDARL